MQPVSPNDAPAVSDDPQSAQPASEPPGGGVATSLPAAAQRGPALTQKQRWLLALIMSFVVLFSVGLVAAFSLLHPAAELKSLQEGGFLASADVGKGLYVQTCAACHGEEAKGRPNLGKDLTTSEFVKALTDPELVKFLEEGRPADHPLNTTKIPMPPRGGNPMLSDQDLRAIVRFMRTVVTP